MPRSACEPAPCGNSVTSAGMLNAAQCQKPAPVGASGSNKVTAKDFVPSGRSAHCSCGETFDGARNCSAISSPSARSVEVKVNVGGLPSGSYGSGPGKRGSLYIYISTFVPKIIEYFPDLS